MRSKELREKFINFFKKREHVIVASSLLVPDDGTVLLTSAGMQQFIPHLSGERDALSDFGSIHLASIQKCFRTPDIEEVGDDTHHTFFEMMGNWSIGENEKGYFKEGSIDLALDFFVKEIGLEKEKLHVTVFKGEENIPADEEAISIWKDRGVPEERIKMFKDDNFWGPTAATGPCGPCTEIHYDRGVEHGCDNCGPNCEKCLRFVELWNLVFMEYNKNEDGSFSKLPQRNVDTGIGFERLVALLQKKNSAYETDLFDSVIKKIEEGSDAKYEDNKEAFRVIADHLRGSVFLLSDGVVPDNKGAGYILRRIIRRTVRYKKKISLSSLEPVISEIISVYKDWYPELSVEKILPGILEEESGFEKTLQAGVNKLKQINKDAPAEKLGEELFFIYQSYGFPLELSVEELGVEIDRETKKVFDEEFKKHQEVSRKGVEERFGGLRKDAGEEEVKLHTATHLLHQALRNVLGDHVRQMGSDINKDRLRFDFSFKEKMSKEEIEEVERVINEKIKEKLDVEKKEMSYDDAVKEGALAFFNEEYGETVSVYSVGDFSKELCGGPHVKNTGELGEFKILKEESSSSGVRRIKATLYGTKDN